MGERRTVRLKGLFYGLFRPRRVGERRQFYQSAPSYVDQHSPFALVIVLSILLLCIGDAYFTLVLIEHGSRELNPIMAWALEKDVMFFYATKYTVTAICVYVLMMHREFLIFGIRGSKFLIAVILFYGGLITYQLSMLFGVF